MKHPTSAQVAVVIANFEKALPIANGFKSFLRMTVPDVYSIDALNINKELNLCGSPMCHGGWYATVTFSNEEICEGDLYYTDGANRMASDLGFEDGEEELCNWAMKNPDLWGNENGRYMFSDSTAFETVLEGTKRYNGAESLQDIVDHWKEVKARLEVLEAQPVEE